MKRMTLEQVDSLLDNGIIQVEFNPSRDDVEIPDNLRNKDVCYVNFSYNYWPHDLLVDEDGIGSTLSFKGDNHWCFIPWEAMFSMWGFNDAGERVVAVAEEPKKERPKLRLIKGGKA